MLRVPACSNVRSGDPNLGFGADGTPKIAYGSTIPAEGGKLKLEGEGVHHRY